MAVIVGAGVMGRVIARRVGEHHRLLVVDSSKEKFDEISKRFRDEGHDGLTRAATTDEVEGAQ